MSFITALAVAFILLPGLAAAGPALAGSFRADPYGTLELRTEGEHVTGVMVDGGACGFDAKRQVLEGDFQGSVLVARLTVCQSGELCPVEQTYAILGFYNEENGAVVAHVRLREGCQSPALLRSGRFILAPVRTALPTETPTNTSASALELASKRGGGRGVEEAKQALDLGMRLYAAKDYKEAARQFEISLRHDSGDWNWPAYLGRGSSLLKLGRVAEAISDLNRSRIANAKVANPREPFILYMLGCAYGQKGEKDKALAYLGQAVNAGYRLHEVVHDDPDLTLALGSDPQFQELLKRSREKKSQPRGSAGTGNSSP